MKNCPECNKKNTVTVMDKGLRFVFRAVIQNNRYQCFECKITWRAKTPDYFQELKGPIPREN